MPAYSKPLPMPHPDTQGFWEAARRHEIALQQCSTCGEFRHPPAPLCPRCHSWDSRWTMVGETGRVVSWIVVHHVVLPGFVDDAPYVVAVVSLDDCPDVRLTTNIVDCDRDAIHLSMPVQAVFDDVTPEVTLIRFRPVAKPTPA